LAKKRWRPIKKRWQPIKRCGSNLRWPERKEGHNEGHGDCSKLHSVRTGSDHQKAGGRCPGICQPKDPDLCKNLKVKIEETQLDLEADQDLQTDQEPLQRERIQGTQAAIETTWLVFKMQLSEVKARAEHGSCRTGIHLGMTQLPNFDGFTSCALF
jgi:hypothetical protein